MVRSNPKFGTGHNFLFSKKDHGICVINSMAKSAIWD